VEGAQHLDFVQRREDQNEKLLVLLFQRHGETGDDWAW
jgi:hypothetical protein